MSWQPSSLTREQMEERRLEGGRLLKKGKLSQSAIASQLGVSRATVSVWNKQLQAGGLRHLRRRATPGRPTRLTAEQGKALLRCLKRGALSAGFATDRWTLPRIQKVSERQFGVTYHVNYLSRLLQKLGWSPQVPLPRARERDEELIEAWLRQDWPRIKKSAATRRKYSLFR
jgi:transposase